MDFRQHQKIFSIFFAIIFIVWALFTYSTNNATSEDLALNFIIVIVGITYPLVIFKTNLSKIFLLVEGILVFSIGMLYLTFYPKILFCAIGMLLVIASVFIGHHGKNMLK
ncbi:MAG: hypothetical protein LBB45_06175 [Methanobrevibacter sp.]|jgi:hypothetical protein|nr:hypothetical protein [Candidatus Methanovirga basalitermitum]